MIQSALIARTNDKLPVIRVQAVLALKRIQEEEIVLATLIKLLNFDSSKYFYLLIFTVMCREVRIAVLGALHFTRKTSPEFVKRCRDVSPDVRAAAFNALKDVTLKHISISQRIDVVKGLKDRFAFYINVLLR